MAPEHQNRHDNKKNIFLKEFDHFTFPLATFCALSFTICVIYGLLTPHSLHMHDFLEMVLPAYKWGSFPLFFLGLVESFLYGAYAGLAYVPIYNFFLKKWSSR